MKASGMCGLTRTERASRQGGGAAASLGLGGRAGPRGRRGLRGGARRAGVSEAEAPIGQRVMQHHYTLCKHCPRRLVERAERIVVYGRHAPFMQVPAFTRAAARRDLFEGRRDSVRHRHRLGRAPAPAAPARHPRRSSAPRAWARPWGARVIAVDIAPERLKLARSSLTRSSL